MDFLATYGYVGLFSAAFLAATLLPLGSEVILGVLYHQGLDAMGLFLAASSGNILGSLLNYALGLGLYHLWQKRQKTHQEAQRGLRILQRYGPWSLLFAWVPIIGDPLTVAAGALKIRFWLFLTLVSIGKAGRYGVLLYLLSLNG